MLIDGSSLLVQRHVRKCSDEENPAILGFFFVIERTQLSAPHVQLVENLRLRFQRSLPISNYPVVRISMDSMETWNFKKLIWQKLVQIPRE